MLRNGDWYPHTNAANEMAHLFHVNNFLLGFRKRENKNRR
jgi:hypothetical protein